MALAVQRRIKTVDLMIHLSFIHVYAIHIPCPKNSLSPAAMLEIGPSSHWTLSKVDLKEEAGREEGSPVDPMI